ncbi:phosphatase PAP2 family protein [Marinomonas mediterranea]|uniref:phosphatase PAP2 family protein n=1 Tax=Marinomonas mediterranea TaxID=119864 RepID=UPI00234BD0D5|nr:phosphatase PAP2 family protein [Marinomonas mediterranea]WCN10296.1 phosphatase PAP2 family protein [Marinomonas mediterranea]WCN14341.1 phosphatase PAP2 family protein [Marinomonas mediterranea]
MFKPWKFGVAPACFVLCAVLFSVWPELDLYVSGLFYDSATSSFPANDNSFVKFIYWIFKEMPAVIVPVLLGLCVLTLFKTGPEWSKVHKRKWYFMLAFLLIGPGIIVHTGFKDNWDRARPRHVVEFGGSKQFTPPLVVSDQCKKNCSFVSGHAAMGFAFIALGWVLKSRPWLFFGLGLGLFVGGIRVLQGGHFLSDIIFSGFICYASAWVMARWILDTCPLERKKREAETEKMQSNAV